MKIVLLFFSLLFIKEGLAQSEKITALNFPYHKGYILNLAGKGYQYNNQTGDKKEIATGTFYHITDETITQKKDVTVFNARTFRGTDTTEAFLSTLWIDKKGMGYVGKNNESTQAILLPLYDGKQWKTKSNGFKSTCTCVGLHIPITTVFGVIDCFAITTGFVIDKTETYQQITKVTEYYNQAIGKVGYLVSMYVEFFNSGKTIPVYDMAEYVVKYAANDEY